MAQKTSGSLTPFLAVLAFLATAGLFYALFVISEPTEIAVAEEDEDPALPLQLNVFQIELEEGRIDAEQRLELSGIIVDGVLGARFFTFQLGDQSEFLVAFDDDLAASGVQVESSDVVDIRGRVHEMTEETLDQWEAGGQIPQGVRDQFAEFQWYMSADELDLQVPDELMDDDDSDPDADGDGEAD
ncbi:MAG: hypothetical protein EA352_09900 [Gemmatimonadales bacterium]|nr:MAG: hypothetical protein EA352_09900 [Gemmatimonadales bacterium]